MYNKIYFNSNTFYFFDNFSSSVDFSVWFGKKKRDANVEEAKPQGGFGKLTGN